MPFTINVGPYEGGNYLAQGLSSLGQGISGGIKSAFDEQRKREQSNDDIIRAGLMQGKVSPEQYVQYRDMNAKGKDSFVAQIARGFAEDFRKETELRRQELEAKTQLTTAQAEEAQRSRLPFTPGVTTVTPPGDKPINLIQTSRNQFSVAPGSQPVSPMMGQPYYHPDTGKAIGTYDENGKVQFFPGQGNNLMDILALFGAGGGTGGGGGGGTFNIAPPNQPQGAAGSPLNAILGRMTGAKPAPQPAAAQPQPPAGVQTAPGYGVSISPKDQEALQWARANPQDPRAAQILAKLGVTQ